MDMGVRPRNQPSILVDLPADVAIDRDVAEILHDILVREHTELRDEQSHLGTIAQDRREPLS